MMLLRPFTVLALGAFAAAALAVPPATPTPAAAPRTPGEIIAAAKPGDWVEIAPSDLLVMTLAPDAAGSPRRVIIQLMPAPFSQAWIGNIRALASAHWWDGTSINRVQDNYVVQWGDPNGDDGAKAKALPAGLAKTSQDDYATPRASGFGTWFPFLRDGNYAPHVGFKSGWPIGWDGDHAWPVHCYGMVGVGRGLAPDAGTGAELYVIIGHAPRHLDRNIALVGRVVSGIEQLSSLPRGTGALGFYEKAEQRVPITSIRLASELPAAERPRFQYLDTASATFADYATARANRQDSFFIKPAGGADVCNVPVPVRAVNGGAQTK
ncbi:peptidylprolyl isomerase [Sphingomonas sp. GlSt437]|uniref:peptidylprolyl isomerase n=2 Tax=Sphingomonas sp. GlSt437 TaxID=3389970 RepID=UPI003EC078DE